MLTILLLSLLGAVIAAVVGTLWYSSATPMGKIHMRAMGFDKLSPEEQQQKIAAAKPMMPKLYAGQFILSFLTSFFVVFMMFNGAANGEPVGLIVFYLVLTWLCFIVPIIGSALLWGTVEKAIVWKKFFSDIFSNLAIILIVAFVVHFFV